MATHFESFFWRKQFKPPQKVKNVKTNCDRRKNKSTFCASFKPCQGAYYYARKIYQWQGNLPKIIYRPCVLHVLVSPQKSLTKLGYDNSSTCYWRKALKKIWIDFMLSKRFLKKKLGEEIFFMEQDKEHGCPEFFHWILSLKIQRCGDPSWRPERNINL